MRFDIRLKVSNLNDSLKFYINELQLFQFGKDLGMGNIIINYNYNNEYGLLLQESSIISKDIAPDALFSLEVKDCYYEYQRISKVSFTGNYGLFKSQNGLDFIEYPLGKVFLLFDPDYNYFELVEWNQNLFL